MTGARGFTTNTMRYRRLSYGRRRPQKYLERTDVWYLVLRKSTKVSGDGGRITGLRKFTGRQGDCGELGPVGFAGVEQHPDAPVGPVRHPERDPLIRFARLLMASTGPLVARDACQAAIGWPTVAGSGRAGGSRGRRRDRCSCRRARAPSPAPGSGRRRRRARERPAWRSRRQRPRLAGHPQQAVLGGVTSRRRRAGHRP